ncbi:MAG: stalk domain-containing protein [Desulfotomaculaceae bacterium]|nr:stalk domain-containing protein [Desulfotomaculaceae bacterium]
MVPLRFLCEALGAKVQWENSIKTIRINTVRKGV